MRSIATCQTCGLEIECKELKDFESHSKIEVLAHFKAEHPELLTEFGMPYTPMRFEQGLNDNIARRQKESL